MSGTEGLLIVGAHARLGYVHYLRGDYDAAYAEFRRELEYVATSDHALRERTLIELHQKLSAVHHARGEDAEALRFGDLAIQAHARRVAAGADDAATRYYIASVYARRGDVERTREHLALPLEPVAAVHALAARERYRFRWSPGSAVKAGLHVVAAGLQTAGVTASLADCDQRQSNRRRDQPLEWQRPRCDERFEQLHLRRGCAPSTC